MSPLRLLICAVGRARKQTARALYQDYARLVRWPLALVEVEVRRQLPDYQRRTAEGALLLEKIPDGAVVVVLDEKGKALSSRECAKRIGGWRDDGCAHIVFLIGGAEGLDDVVRSERELS